LIGEAGWSLGIKIEDKSDGNGGGERGVVGQKGTRRGREGGGPQPGAYMVQSPEDIASSLEAKIQHHHGYQIYAYSFALS